MTLPHSFSSAIFRLFSALLLTGGLALSGLATEVVKSFDVPAGDAITTLKQAAQQGGVEIMFPADTVQGVKTAAVKGELTPHAALGKMLDGTGLVAVQDKKTGALAVKKDPLPNAPRAALNEESRRPSRTSNENGDQTVVLSPFQVKGKSVGPYQASEATSGGRIAQDIFDSTQSITVITNQFIKDVGASDILAAAQYFSGVSQSSFSIVDRFSLRGFQSQPTVDGFTSAVYGNAANSEGKLDPSLIERMEFVKGPNTITSPNGFAGGTLNIITKKPAFRNFGAVSATVGQYNTNRASFDINRMISDQLAVRLVLAANDYQQGYEAGYNEGVSVMPSLAYRTKGGGDLIVRYKYNYTKMLFASLPIDPSAGTETEAQLLMGLPRNALPYDQTGDYSDGVNYESASDLFAEYLMQVTPAFSVRFAAHGFNALEETGAYTFSAPTGGATDPRTGIYTPGYTYGPAPDFTATPVARPSSIYNRSNTMNTQHYYMLDLHNDYVHTLNARAVKLTSAAGWALNAYQIYQSAPAWTRPPLDIFNFVPTPATPVASKANKKFTGNYKQIYLNENVKLFEERLILNAGIAKDWFYQKIADRLANTSYSTKPSPTLLNYGVVVKATKNAQAYFNHSETGHQINNPPVAGALVLDQDLSTQNEVGVRLYTADHRAVLTISHFKISQDNFLIVNPGLYTFPPPTPGTVLPFIVSNRVCKGWEAEVNISLASSISFVGNYTDFKNRNAYDVPFRGTAERSGAAWLQYKKKDGALRGLGLGLGVTYMDKRPGDQGSGLAAGSTSTNPIPNQPTFYLPAVKLINAAASYTWDKDWEIKVFIDNLANEEYLASSLGRNFVQVGIPRNFRASVTYAF